MVRIVTHLSNIADATVVVLDAPFDSHSSSVRYQLRIDDEEMSIVSGVGTRQLVVDRGANGTAIAWHLVGTEVETTATSYGSGGSVGPQGPVGPSGPQGPTGAAGSQGPAGVDGVAGPAGAQGLQGPQGDQGPGGPTGSQGDPGPAGPSGAQGLQGIAGDPGPAGPQGSQGPEGPQGLQGIQGIAGPPGTQGEMGQAGPQGIQGVAGPEGPAGPSIPTGVIVMWGGLVTSIPSGWALCDGTGGTPDLRSKFVKGAAPGADPGATGGATTHTHADHSGVINHTHPVTDPGHAHALNRYPTATGALSGFTADTSMSGTLTAVTLTSQGVTTGITTTNPAGGVAALTHDSPNSEPPYYALCFIQKL